MRRFARLLPLVGLALLVLLQSAFAAPQQERRVALIIGNSAYKDAPLKNPVNDARDMAAALKQLGFEATLLTDATMQQMESAVREFGLKLRQGGMGLFYYAGHGVQVAGNNYLVPVKAVIQSESDVKYGCLDAGLVLGKMEDAGNGLNLVILDACRNNPFARSFRSAEQGLAKMDAPTGSLIAYATSPGKTAADGDGKNGLYTKHLLRNITTPGLSVEELFKRVRQGVAGDSAKKQVPWEASSLIGQFSFAGGEHTASLGPAAPVVAAPAPGAKPLDLKAEKKRLADEAAPFKREKEELAQLQAPPPPAEPKAGDTWRDPVTGMEFVRLPQGCFRMGSPSSEVGLRSDAEGPVHEVCISALWVGQYAVTVGQFRKFVQATGYKTDAEKQGKAWGMRSRWAEISGLDWQNPGFAQDDRHPAATISWNDAQEYAQWLSGQGNGKFRLMTEAEWEYAARAGTSTSRFWGDNPDDACKFANVSDQTWKRTYGRPSAVFNCDDGYAQTAPVGSFRPNAFGLYDMLGNVWQWCEDVYNEDAYVLHSRDNPIYTGGGSNRVIRGGTWYGNAWVVRAAFRGGSAPDARSADTGFRLVRVP